MYKCVVVGKGMIGSAAAKYLSHAGDGIATIGPDEPTDWKSHDGVFSSHYDAGRITRILDTEYVWALAAKRSIEAYPVIEEKSGIKFFEPRGCVKVVPDDAQGHAYLDANEANGNKLGAVTQRTADADLKARWSFLQFPEKSIGVWEQKTAGIIDPRKLVAAQLVLAKQNGTDIVNDTVVKITRVADGRFDLETLAGKRYESEKVIVAAGGFTNCHNLLPHRLDIRPRKETVQLARITDEYAKEIASMPSVIWFLHGHPNLTYVYVLPPIKYPDGKYYVKMGGDREMAFEFTELKQLIDWFHSSGGEEAARDFKALMEQLLPNMKAEEWISKPCVITDTKTERPYIGPIEPNLFVATGGCGAAAKSSDEFGRIAALYALGQSEPSYGNDPFPVVFDGGSNVRDMARQFKF